MLINDGRPFHVRQLPDLGLTRWTLRLLVDAGEVRRVTTGVYVDERAPDDLRLRAAATALVLPPGAVVCRSTAAWLFGVDVLLINEHLRLPPVEVCSRDGRGVVRRQGVRGFSALLDDAEVAEVHGVPVTSPTRTALDLARWYERPDALAAVDAMLHSGVVRPEMLAAGLDGLRLLPWAEQAREIVDLADARAESPMESRMRLRYIDAGFPSPECQIVVPGPGSSSYRIDCGVRRRRYGFEFDGEEFHGPEREFADAQRREWLRADGWVIDVFRREHVLGRGFDFERAIGESLSLEPRLQPWEARRRTYLRRRRLG